MAGWIHLHQAEGVNNCIEPSASLGFFWLSKLNFDLEFFPFTINNMLIKMQRIFEGKSSQRRFDGLCQTSLGTRLTH